MSNGNVLLIITDGTAKNTASMQAKTSGAFLDDWLPKSPQPASPIWTSSPYLDGKRLVTKNYDNIIDTFTLIISTQEQDKTIFELNKFLFLLERAVEYWEDDYSTQKFWLEVRGTCETNIRYALVVDYNIPETNNPFAPPYNSTNPSTIDEIQLTIEHTIWSDTVAIGTNCVEINTAAGHPMAHMEAFRPAASTDDAYTATPAGTINTGGVSLSMGNSALGDNYDLGIRFRTVNIPAGAIIARAYMYILAWDNLAVDNCNVTIKGEDSVTPAVFSTYANFWARARLATTVNWSSIPHFSAGNWYQTPDITSVIAAIVAKPGWASGNNLVVFFENNASSANAMRTIASYDSGAVNSVILIVEWYDPATLVLHGEPDTCSLGPAVVPFQKILPLDYAFTFDNSTGLFGPNLVDDTIAVAPALLPAVAMQVTDCCYFGISDRGDPNFAEPFNNLVIHLATASVDVTTCVLEYWTGAAWTLFGGVDYEPIEFWSPSAQPGIHFVQWALPNDWVQCTISNIAGYWMRLRPTVLGANPTPPYQLARTAVYTVTQSHIEIIDTEITGNISAAIDFLLTHMGENAMDTLMICAKKYSHTNNAKFRPYIPCKSSIVGLPDASVIAIFGAPFADSSTYTGYSIQWAPGVVVVPQSIVEIKLGAKTYAGIYRAYLRIRLGTGVNSGQYAFRMQILNYIQGTQYYSEWVRNQAGFGGFPEYFEVLDLGYLEFPSLAVLETDTDPLSNATIIIEGLSNAGGTTVNLLDLVLMPVDEQNIEISINTGNSGFEYELKSVTSNVKVGPYAVRLKKGTTISEKMTFDWNADLLEGLRSSILGMFALEPKERYWIYFFAYEGWMPVTADDIFEYLICPSLNKQQRYLLARGAE